MNKRPKSREETPKEGSDSARRYRTATICDRAAQSASLFGSFPVQNRTPCGSGSKKSQIIYFINRFNGLITVPRLVNRHSHRPARDLPDFVIDGMIKKFITTWADSKPKNGRRKWGQTPVPRARAAGLG
jgi:hypothetical protein